MATLVDDEAFEDLYRPEPSAPTRAPRRGPTNPAASNGDFAERSRLRRARAAMLRDGHDEGYDHPSTDEYADDYDDELDARPASARNRKRVPIGRNGVRTSQRSGLLATKWRRIGLAVAAVAVLGVLTSIFMLVRGFFLHDPRFRIATASSIQILGNSDITRNDLLGVFGSDIGHDIFTVPLAARRASLQQLPWVQSATVMRLLPNQLRVSIVERVPAAFVREGSKIELVDATGVILSLSPAMLAARHYSFPVVIGINANDPAETRADRMQLYEKFVKELDSTASAIGSSAKTSKSGTPVKVSQQLSEVDVSDPEDIRALMPSAGADILVHFGDGDFANRYHVYQTHLAQWRQQFPHLASIDLRYDRQTVLEMARGTSGETAKVETTPTLAAATTVRAKPSASIAATADAKKMAHPTKPSIQPATKAKKSKPAGGYVQPFDNPHASHG